MFNTISVFLAGLASTMGLGGSYDKVGVSRLNEHRLKLRKDIIYYHIQVNRDDIRNLEKELIDKYKDMSVQGEINTIEFRYIKDCFNKGLANLIFKQADNILHVNDNGNDIEHIYFFKLAYDKDKNLNGLNDLNVISQQSWRNIICKSLNYVVDNYDECDFNPDAINKVININLQCLYDCNLYYIIKLDDDIQIYPEHINSYIENYRYENRFLSESNPKGLKNLGQSCYINALLQALTNLSKFKCELLAVENNYPENSFSKSLIKFLKDYASKSPGINAVSHANVTHKIWDFKDNLGRSLFAEGTTSDSHELFLKIIDCLVEEGVAQNRLLTTSSIKDLFHMENNKYNGNYLLGTPCTIGLEIPICQEEGDNLRISEDLYEAMSENYFSSRPEEPQNINSVTKIKKAPDILVISMMRYYCNRISGEITKICNNISFPFELNMDRYLDRAYDQADRSAIYDLNSIIMHHGSGYHYTVYLKKDNGWYYCNDDIYISEIPLSEDDLLHEIRSQYKKMNPYVLIYSKKDNRIPSVHPENMQQAESDNEQEVEIDQNLICEYIGHIKHDRLKQIIRESLDEKIEHDLDHTSNIYNGNFSPSSKKALNNYIIKILEDRAKKDFEYICLKFNSQDIKGTLHLCYTNSFGHDIIISIIRLEDKYPFIILTSKDNNLDKIKEDILPILRILHDKFIKPHQEDLDLHADVQADS